MQTISQLEQQFLFQTYDRYPVTLDRGEGCYLWDTDGRCYLDLITGTGVAALGHAHPRIVAVIQEQAARLLHTSNNYYHRYQGALAERLCRLSGLDRAFFCNSGAEAVELALKIARARDPGRPEIVSLENSFHGRTLGALAVTGQPKYRRDFEPLPGPVRFVRSGQELREAVNGRTAAILVEAVQGEGGIYPLSDAFLQLARELASEHGALLIADEIQCGLGRTGSWFGVESSSVQPDVILLAKPLAGGLPLGAVLATEEAASAIGVGMHGSTFGGGPLACRVALEVIDEVERLLPQIRQTAGYFAARLEDLRRDHAIIREVRSRGLMLALDLTSAAHPYALAALDQGLLVNATHETVLRLLPPYTLSRAQVDEAIAGLAKALQPRVATTSRYSDITLV